MSPKPSSSAASPSLAAWQARAFHEITLPSSQRVRIRIPGIATLLQRGDLPSDLADLALLELTSEGGATVRLAADLQSDNGDSAKALARLADYGRFQRELVRAAVVAVETSSGTWQDVQLSLDDTADLPENDLAMVAEIVQRLRAHDARGVRIGVEPLDRWAAFRDAHGCPDEDCPGCQELVRRLSSVDMGDV